MIEPSIFTPTLNVWLSVFVDASLFVVFCPTFSGLFPLEPITIKMIKTASVQNH